MTFKKEAFLTYLALVPVVTGVIIASGVSQIQNHFFLWLFILIYAAIWFSISFTCLSVIILCR
jgi:hypothetical protein